jgi:SAM-dependent methyltransferase
MSKVAEQAYLEKLGAGGRQHAKEKPFSDINRGLALASMGAIFTLLPPPPGRLLDLGCGTGWTSVFFAKSGYDVVGQDISLDMIRVGEENKAFAAATSLNFVHSDYEGLGFRDEFDCAVFFDSLHHAVDERAALRSAFDALKPGGVLITHEPGEGHATTPASIEAMAQYGVTERDMPPHLIIRRGREIGFGACDVFPMPHELNRFFYQNERPRFNSRPGLTLARELLRVVFRRPDEVKIGAIVRLVKPLR